MTLTRFRPRTFRLLFIYLAVAITLFWALAPIYWVVVSSISTRTELYTAPKKVWFPSSPTFQNYHDLFTTGPKYRAGASCPQLI